MRRRSVLLGAALALAGSACSSAPAPHVAEPPPAEVPLLAAPPPTAPPPTAPPKPPVKAQPAAPPRPSLPQPVVIPDDSYAPEPVVEIGTMEIPAIGLRHRIFQGVTLHNIDRGPSHWTGSAMPGEMGNTVFAGHRATHSQPFLRIDELVAGDMVVFTVRGTRSTYRVTDHLIVRPSDSWIGYQTEAYTGTLYACHPVGSMAERYVVRMELVR